MKTFLYIFAGGAFSFAAAIFWWRLWMYRGFAAPPQFLMPFITADGEAAYDRVALEMFLVVFVAITLTILFYRFKESNQKKCH